MAKKKPGSVPNRHIYTRISFLYQASACLSQAAKQDPNTASADAGVTHDTKQHHATTLAQQYHSLTAARSMARRLLTDFRAIGQKTNTRANPHLKRSICKYCDSLLIEGQTSSSAIENKSKGGKKPWADVLVVKCQTCGGEKRFPVSPRENKRRPFREAKGGRSIEQDAAQTTEGQKT